MEMKMGVIVDLLGVKKIGLRSFLEPSGVLIVVMDDVVGVSKVDAMTLTQGG
ncbi:hypothetical protein D3C86_1851880 [compost metagenome]